ncbi:helix-turn-helix domain-containing protein [Mariniluteicoccus flavus]
MQTLDRGLSALEVISLHPAGLTVAAIGDALDVHRAIAYRVVATLTDHGLVVRTPDGRVRLAAGIATLADRYAAALRQAARPVLAELARDTLATSYLAVAEGEECVVVAVDEAPGTVLQVGYRVGSRHPLARGASGIAILARRPAAGDDREDVRRARADGFAVTQGQLQAGAIGVASAIGDVAQGIEACVGVVALEDLDVERATASVVRAARVLGELG